MSAGTKEDGDAAIDSNNANNGAGGRATVETLRSCLLPPIKIKLDINKRKNKYIFHNTEQKK